MCESLNRTASVARQATSSKRVDRNTYKGPTTKMEAIPRCGRPHRPLLSPIQRLPFYSSSYCLVEIPKETREEKYARA